jgi:cytochrome oxidase Cu insertion factor (SCO1/SenC/PrrC family)
MTDKAKIILIYSTVVVVGIVVVGISMWISKKREQMFSQQPMAVGIGKEEPDVLMELEGDLELVNQAGEPVKISDLDGKVWVVHQFFANCPVCLKQNSDDLVALYREFGGHPDFQMVSISVDPERDTVEFLSEYAGAVGADPKNWWFVRGEKEEVYRFLTEKMKYAPIVERPGAEGAARYGHDFGIQVYGRERRLVRQRDLVSGKSFGEDIHAERLKELRERIALRLDAPLPPRGETSAEETE